MRGLVDHLRRDSMLEMHITGENVGLDFVCEGCKSS